MWWTNSLCTLANEDLGSLAEYYPLTLLVAVSCVRGVFLRQCLAPTSSGRVPSAPPQCPRLGARPASPHAPPARRNTSGAAEARAYASRQNAPCGAGLSLKTAASPRGGAATTLRLTTTSTTPATPSCLCAHALVAPVLACRRLTSFVLDIFTILPQDYPPAH